MTASGIRAAKEQTTVQRLRPYLKTSRKNKYNIEDKTLQTSKWSSITVQIVSIVLSIPIIAKDLLSEVSTSTDEFMIQMKVSA
jgi:hypothetical protein